ncbi:hypothetical protein TeGR_g7886 [Tetraparma gracilis]|uniref:Uncharacterized protein n=1 Tax=Tetraparma gracilis TaxID=2962635 RepID=A0ABQ6MIG6_9STRA|nr:hypothetical protein TeGR_g7886 [Tetraparma gracilis]
MTEGNPYGLAWASEGGDKLKKSGFPCLTARAAADMYGIDWDTFCKYKVPAYKHGGGWGNSDLYFYVAHKDCELLQKHFADEKEQKLKDLHGAGYEAFKAAQKKKKEEAANAEAEERRETMDRASEQRKVDAFRESVRIIAPFFERGETFPNGTDAFESETFNKTEAKKNFKMNDADMKQVAAVQVGKKTMWRGADLFQFATRSDYSRKKRQLDTDASQSEFARGNAVFSKYMLAKKFAEVESAAGAICEEAKAAVMEEIVRQKRADVESARRAVAQAEKNVVAYEALQGRLVKEGGAKRQKM